MANELNIKRAQQLLQFVNISSEVMKRYQNDLQKQAGQIQAVKEKLPDLLQVMVDNERIAEHQKDAVAKAIENPVQCMELMTALAKHRNSSEVQTVGKPVGSTKSASTQKRVIGGKVTNWDDTAAGQEFRRSLYGTI